MVKHPFLIKLGVILFCSLLLAGCMFSLTKPKNHENYVLGFPPEDSPALVTMMDDYIRLEKRLLKSSDSVNIITDHDINSKNNELTYSQYTTDELIHYYSTLRDAEDKSSELYQLAYNGDFTQEVNDLEKWGLPEIVRASDNELYIRTSKSEKTIDLNDLGDNNNIDLADQSFTELQAITEDSLLLEIHDPEKGYAEGRVNKWFLKQDLSDSVLIGDKEEDLEAFLSDDSFQDYQGLFPKINNQEQYRKSYFEGTVIDVKKGEVLDIGEEDYLSVGGDFVYIDGKADKLLDGEQKIQRTEDYMEGNENYYAEFDIDFSYINKRLDLDATDIKIANISYFNEDYIMLFLKYAAPITGSAGSTNVLIDLQEDETDPMFYIVDLDLNS